MGKDSINILSNPGKGYVKNGASPRFLQSAEFKVQSANDVSHTRRHNLLDCFAALAMTRMWRFLEVSDHPAAARHPSNGGELGALLYFSHCGRRGNSRYCALRINIIAHAL